MTSKTLDTVVSSSWGMTDEVLAKLATISAADRLEAGIPSDEVIERVRREAAAGSQGAEMAEDAIASMIKRFGVPQDDLSFEENIHIVFRILKSFAESGEGDVKYSDLSLLIIFKLAERLQQEGLSELDAHSFAVRVISHFNVCGSKVDAESDDAIGTAVDLVMSVLHVTGIPTPSFEGATRLRLPPSAPGIWAEHADRLPGETPVKFLRRVWGRYMDAGLLYQDDIKRLGDDKLVRAVRSYCQKHSELKASDVLPPPGRARLERALEAADPNSPEAAALRTRMAMRASGRRHARKKRAGAMPRP